MTPACASKDVFPVPLAQDKNAVPPSDVELLNLTRGMRAGADDAWSEFHRRYYFILLRLAAARAARPDDAVEIVQQTYLRVARHIRPFQAEDQFRAWLGCLVRCAAMDHQRGAARRTALMERFAHWQAAQQTDLDTGERRQDALAQEALAGLPAEDAQMLRRKYYEDWSVEQLATDAQTTPKTIENRLARLRRQLREIILRIK